MQASRGRFQFTSAHNRCACSQGYVIYSERKKLKAELQGKTQAEIRDLRLSGMEVTDTFEVSLWRNTPPWWCIASFKHMPSPISIGLCDGKRSAQLGHGSRCATLPQCTFCSLSLGVAGVAPGVAPSTIDHAWHQGQRLQPFTLSTSCHHSAPVALQTPEVAFTGDTTAEFLDRATGNEDFFKARLLIIEMSFIDDTVTPLMARGKGHMHIADFLAHAHKFKNEEILLIHFSPRYKRQDILEQLDMCLPPSLHSKCTPFLNGFD